MISRWISTDPPLSTGEYLPVPPVNDKARRHNQNLPGMGGVFNPINLDSYQYAGQNPVIFVDPDGEKVYLIHRAIGDQSDESVRSATWNPLAHAYIVTAENNGNTKFAASWNAMEITDIGSWNTDTSFLEREAEIADIAIESGKALALTSDDRLDSFIEKASAMLALDESPSNHLWGLPEHCQGETGRLLGVAFQIYAKEKGEFYDGLTFSGKYMFMKNKDLMLNKSDFNKLYQKAFENDR